MWPRTFLKCHNSGLTLSVLTFGLQIFLLNCLLSHFYIQGFKVKCISFLHCHNIVCPSFKYFIYCGLPDVPKFYTGLNILNIRSSAQTKLPPTRIASYLIPTTSCLLSRCLWVCFSRPVETIWASFAKANMNSAYT